MSLSSTRAPVLVRPGRPLTLTMVGGADLVVAGLRAVLDPFSSRVRLVDDTPARAPALDVAPDVMLVDLTGVARPTLGSVASSRPCTVGVGFDEPPMEQRRSLGLDGFVPLTLDATGLVAALESAHARHGNAGGAELPGGLARREAEVLAGIVRGQSNQEIADELYLSINSVKTYVRGAYRKMGVERRSQAVLWGIQHGY